MTTDGTPLDGATVDLHRLLRGQAACENLAGVLADSGRAEVTETMHRMADRSVSEIRDAMGPTPYDDLLVVTGQDAADVEATLRLAGGLAVATVKMATSKVPQQLPLVTADFGAGSATDGGPSAVPQTTAPGHQVRESSPYL